MVIANRTPDRARALAQEFSDLGEITACGILRGRGARAYDLIINATSASLQGEMPAMPVGAGERGNASATTWPTAAATRRSRCWARSLHAARTTKGWGMLVEQAAESFLLWRGIRPDTGPVLEALAQHT